MRAPAARAALWTLGVLGTLRVAHWLGAPPNSDEAYYWLWGRHPALSYLDHPPLHAWLQSLAHEALGTSRLSLRAWPAVTSLATGWAAWRLGRRLAPADAAAGPWSAVALLASPLVLMLAGFAWQDHLLVLFLLLGGSLLLDVLDEVARGGRGDTVRLLGAGLCLGLAGLSKYSAVLPGLAALWVVGSDRRLRPLLRDPRLWLAAALALAVVSPVLLWNAGRGGASFHFHLAGRIAGGGAVRWNPLGWLRFLAPLAVLAGPFGLLAALRPARPPPAGGFAALHRRLALASLALTLAFFLALSTVTTALFYWAVVGLVLLLPAAATAGRPGLLAAHAAWGVAAAAVMTAHATLLPLTALVDGVKDDDSRMTWGFPELAAAVGAELAARPGAFVATSDYRSAASLAFALDVAGVEALAERRSQFDLWRDDAALAGRDAVLVVEPRQPMRPWLAGHFAAVRRLGEVEARRFDVPVQRYELWLGEGYRPRP